MTRQIYSGVSGRLSRLWDSTLAIFAPVKVHEMRKARMRSAAMLAYEAAQIGRTWSKTKTGSGDSDSLPDLKTLRDQCRTMVRDDAHGSSQANVLEDNVVGEGIQPLPAADAEACGITREECDRWHRDCLEEWRRWSTEEADITGDGDFADLQRIAVRSMLGDGEVFGHAVAITNGLSCELIDADRVVSPGRLDTEKYRGGIELDELGRRVAVWILDQHPDDIGILSRRFSYEPRRVPVRAGPISIVQHLFKRDRPGQSRGVPWLTAAVTFSRHLHHYLQSELIAARANANVAMVVKKAAAALDPDIFPVAAATGDGVGGPSQAYEEHIRPGTKIYLNEGESMDPFLPNRPGSSFSAFVERILRASAASTGQCYELIAKDLGGLNYSSARTLLLEVRRTFDKVRKMVNRQFNGPWWNNVILTGIVTGRLRPPGRFLDHPSAFLRVRWVAPAYGWVDPAVEIEASRGAVEANLSTPYSEAQRSGLDAEMVLRERARFLQRAREIEAEHGLEPGTLTAASGEVRTADRRSVPARDKGQSGAPSEANDGTPPESE